MDGIREQIAEHVRMMLDAQQNFTDNSAARAAVGTHITALGELIRVIEAEVKNIESVSMQVKILSLNASIEAARAGAAGKGFSVVAQEIRSLSDNTDKAVKEIEETVRNMHQSVQGAARDMDNARQIGAEFTKKLEQCVDNAKGLRTPEASGATGLSVLR